MRLFNFTKSKNTSVPEITQTSPINPNPSKEDNKKKDKDDHIYTIIYGTKQPIDVIYTEISCNKEESGYADAMVTTDAAYCQQKEEMLFFQLKNLIQRVELRYKQLISEANLEYANAEAVFATGRCSALASQKEVYQQHLEEVQSMKQKLDNREPEMMIMINSYHRGFVRGMATKNN